MVARDTQIVGGLAVFIIVVGVVAVFSIAMSVEPQLLDENVWVRVNAEGGNLTIASITISYEHGKFSEYFMYINDGDWQASEKKYEVGDVLSIVIQYLETGEYDDFDYRVGRGPYSIDTGIYYTEVISYWEEPDF